MFDALTVVQKLKEDIAAIATRLDQLALQLGAGNTAPSERDLAGRPFYGFSPKDGFHVLKDKWYQKSFIGQQSKELREGLDAAISATRKAVPRRTSEQSFRLISPSGRISGEKIRGKERKLENTIWKRWKPRPDLQPCDAWKFIAACQVPLFDASEKRGWGHIDLLGVDEHGLLVIELKDGSSKEPPTRPLMEAASYAIALQENWPGFMAEFEALLDEHDVTLTSDLKREQIRLMLLAPHEYWERWRKAQTVTRAAWDEYSLLIKALKENGLETRFADLNLDGDADGHEVRVIDCPPR